MFKTLNIEEMLEKKVVGFGNGSIVYTPKKWIGKTVLVVLEEKPRNVNEEILDFLKPLMPGIEGVFLFGSFARNEQTKDSDVDVLVIYTKKLEIKKYKNFDFLVKTKEQFTNDLKNDYNLFLHQILNEAKPVSNEALLNELKQIKTAPDFSRFFDETLNAFKNIKELLETDKQRGKKSSDSTASVYSLILRLKTIFLMQCFKEKKAFSNKKFVEFLKNHGFKDKTVNGFLEVYRAERDDKKTGTKILLEDLEKLFEAAKKEFLKTEKMVS